MSGTLSVCAWQEADIEVALHLINMMYEDAILSVDAVTDSIHC